jgi:hypothetical protein
MRKVRKRNEKKLSDYLEKNKEKYNVYFKQNIKEAGIIPNSTQTTK